MDTIKEHTRQVRQERLSQRAEGRSDSLGFSRPLQRARKEVSNVSSTYSHNMDSYMNTARMHGHNTNVGKGVWSVSSRPAPKPYQRNLADAYPRNEYTMMPMQRNAPKYYDGRFMSYDHKDMAQVSAGDHFEGRPIMYKPQKIENVQTKKKYGMNLKGVSAVPLHLCDDVTSELFQRSLDPEYKARDRSHMRTGREAEIAELSAVISRYPDNYLPAKNQHQTSTLHPLNFGNTTRRWVENAYPSIRTETKSSPGRIQDGVESTMTSDFDSRYRERDVKSGSNRTTYPEWYTDFFPRQKLADALKFMGSPDHHKSKSKEYVLDFNTR